MTSKARAANGASAPVGRKHTSAPIGFGACRAAWVLAGLLVLTGAGSAVVSAQGLDDPSLAAGKHPPSSGGSQPTLDVVPIAFQRPAQSGFDLRKSTVPLKRIASGGVPKDGIPALTDPKQIAAREATFMKPDDRIVGITLDGVARAYPLSILNYHEIVNDRIGQLPFAVTYCPLCDSAAIFDRRSESGEREFGVSGLLYNSNVLMYDRGGKPQSLWSQLKAEGISGPGASEPLKTLPVELTTWKDWLARNPRTTVLSNDTGHRHNYGQNPYAAYFRSPKLMFAAKPTNRLLPAKEPVLGVWTAGAARAYPLSAFGNKPVSVPQQLDGRDFEVEFDPASRTLRVSNADEGIQWVYSFWFAWYAIRPQTEIYKPSR